MILGQTLKAAVGTLQQAGSRTARLDAEVILAFVLGKNRAWLLAHADDKLTAAQSEQFAAAIGRRSAGEPLAYITGFKEFYGRNFAVTPDVLVPRPESESFIELLKELRTTERVHNLLDMGTGCGILAITAKLEQLDLYITATDTSKAALKVAIGNALKLEASVNFKEQNLLTGDKEGYDVVLANLPYVPTVTEPDPSIANEPSEALFSGPDGLEHYRKLFEQLRPKHIRFVMIEALESQHEALIAIAKAADYKLTSTNVLVQLFTKFSTPYGQK